MGIQRKHPAVGIDLGTTYSVVARLDDQGRPETVPNADGDKLTPSVVLFDGSEVVVGKDALKAMATDMDRVAECAKRDLGLRLLPKVLDGRQYPPEAIEGWILNKLRLDTQRRIGEFSQVVVTVPAYFDEVRRKATQDAGYMAGFEVLDIVNEPTAAAVAFGFQEGFLDASGGSSRPRNILVYDLGGGTFDITLMRIEGRNFTTLATDGDVRLGGRDWDQRLIDHVAEEFIRRFGGDPREDPNTYGRLWRDCEDLKRTLSGRGRGTVTCDYHGEALRVEVTREKLHELTHDLLDRTAFTTRQTLQAAGLAWSEVDRILLVGGSTRIPAVSEMLRGLSGQAPDASVSPDEAVAHGAALYAGLVLARHQGRSPRFRVRNVNSHSLGVVALDPQTKRSRNAILIPRNTGLPAVARRLFKTHKPDQRSIKVQIVEGESASPEDTAQVGCCAVRDLPPALPAGSDIEVRFRYLANGRLTVTVQVVGTEAQLEHEITRENSLTREQLDAWRKHISGLPPGPWDDAASGVL